MRARLVIVPALVVVVVVLMVQPYLVTVVSAAAALQITDNTSPLTFGVASDTNLYRTGGPTLRTDSTLKINGTVRAANLLAATTVIGVCPTLGAGCQYTSLAAAVNFVKPLFLSAPLTITVAAGTYNEPNIVFANFAHPSMITIRGSQANPDSVVLRQTQAGSFLVFTGRGCDGLIFSGFRIIALNQDVIPVVMSFTRVFVPGISGGATPTLIIQGGVYCILAQFHALMIASTAITCTGNSYGVNFQYGSTLFCNLCRFTGAGVVGSWAAYSAVNSYVHVGTSSIVGGYTYGQACTQFSMMIGGGTTYGGIAAANYQVGCTGQFA